MEIDQEATLSIENLLEEKYQLWNKNSHYDSTLNIFAELDHTEKTHFLDQSQGNDFLKETEEFGKMSEALSRKLSERKRMKERIASLLEENERVEKYNRMKNEFTQRYQEVALLLESQAGPDEKKDLVPLSEEVLKKISSLFHGERIFQYICQFPQKQPITKSGSDGSFYYFSFSIGDLPESRIVVSSSVL